MRVVEAALLLLLAPAVTCQWLTAVHLADLPALILGSSDPLHTYKCLVLTGRDDGGADTLRTALGDPRCAIVALTGGVTVLVSPARGSLTVRRSVSVACEQLLAGLTIPSLGSPIPTRLANASASLASNASAERLGAKLVKGCVLDGAQLAGSFQSIVSVKGGSSVNFTDIQFVNGGAPEGGALLINGTRLVVVDHCSFTNNGATVSGGAVASINSALAVIGSVFRGNTVTAPALAPAEGGAVFASGGELAVTLCSFGNNVATIGGGIFVSNTNLQIHWSAFFNNAGGAVAQFGTGNFNPLVRTLISFNVFAGNVATNGSALLVYGSGQAGSLQLDVNHCHFLNNTATQFGGAIATSNGVASNLTANEFKLNTDSCPLTPPGSSIYIDLAGPCLDVVAVHSQLLPTCGVISLQHLVRRSLPDGTTCSPLQTQLLGPFCCQSDPLLDGLCKVSKLSPTAGCPAPVRHRLAA